MRILKKQDWIEIAYGMSLRSDGGDYPLEYALKFIEEIEEQQHIETPLYSLDEVDDTKLLNTVGKLGPISTYPEKVGEAASAIKAIQRNMELAKERGEEIGYLYSWEYCNCLVPMLIRVLQGTGLPFVDADSSARSVPTINNVLPQVAGLDISPLICCTPMLDLVTIETPDPNDSSTMEWIGRAMVVAMDDFLSTAPPPLTKQQVADTCYIGAITKLQETGKAMLKALNEGSDPVEGILNVWKSKVLIKGTIVSMDWECRDGFDFGVLSITDGKQTYKLYIQNENCAMIDEKGEILIAAPDSIGFLDVKTCRGVCNMEMVPGLEVIVFGFKASEPWYKLPKAFDTWQIEFNNLGLDIKERVPFLDD